MVKKIVVLLILSHVILLAQDVNIVRYLKDIEAGKADEVRLQLPALQRENPDSPAIKFLEAVLTEEGDIALARYERFYNNYPDNVYADAALYRVFSYYYSLGVYNKAEEYLEKLKDNYPDSPYIRAADRNIPDEMDEDNASTPVSEVEYKTPEPKTIVSSTPESMEKVTVFEEEKEEKSDNGSASVSGKYSVQAGAFISASNAKDLAAKIEKDGYSVSLSTKNVGGSTLNVVMVGSFNSRTEGEVIIDYLQARHKLKGRIVETGN